MERAFLVTGPPVPHRLRRGNAALGDDPDLTRDGRQPRAAPLPCTFRYCPFVLAPRLIERWQHGAVITVPDEWSRLSPKGMSITAATERGTAWSGITARVAHPCSRS